MLTVMSRSARPYTRRAFIGRAAAAAAVPGAVAVAAKLAGGSPASARLDRDRTAGRAGAAGRPTGRTQSAAAAENSLPGDRGWWISRIGAPDAILGYAGQASVLPGEPVQLYVSTTSREFRVR